MDNPEPYKPLAGERCWNKFCHQYDDEWFSEQRTCHTLMSTGHALATKQWNAWVIYAATAKLLGEA